MYDKCEKAKCVDCALNRDGICINCEKGCQFIPKDGAEDSVSHPSHYTYGKIECIDFIIDKKLNFCLGNAIKYIVRAGHKKSDSFSIKDKTIQDLEKAKQYIDFELESLRGERP